MIFTLLIVLRVKGDPNGDIDTTAAIAGALYGYDAIPEKWLNTLKKRDYIEEMCEVAGKEWSKTKS